MIAGVHVMQADLRRPVIVDILGQPEVAFVGNRRKDFRPGTYTIVVVDHAPLPADVAVNVFTDLDTNPSNDAIGSAENPTVPLTGTDGGYSVFGGSGTEPRVFSTDFSPGKGAGNVRRVRRARQANQYYQGRQPFAGMRTAEQTAFLIPPGGAGPTITPFVFSDGEYHNVDVFPNGTLPLGGYIPLPVTCMSQYVRHVGLVYEGLQVSASADVVSACFRLTGTALEVASGPLGFSEIASPITVRLDSWDPQSRGPRPQTTIGQVSLKGDRLYVSLPGGILRFGRYLVNVTGFESTRDERLDALMSAAADTFNLFLGPIAVDAEEGLYQGDLECVPNADQPLEG